MFSAFPQHNLKRRVNVNSVKAVKSKNEEKEEYTEIAVMLLRCHLNASWRQIILSHI